MLTNFVDKLKKGLIKKKRNLTLSEDNYKKSNKILRKPYIVERIEDLATKGYEGIPEYFKKTVTIDAFPRGCNEKRAPLAT